MIQCPDPVRFNGPEEQRHLDQQQQMLHRRLLQQRTNSGVFQDALSSGAEHQQALFITDEVEDWMANRHVGLPLQEFVTRRRLIQPRMSARSMPASSDSSDVVPDEVDDERADLADSSPTLTRRAGGNTAPASSRARAGGGEQEQSRKGRSASIKHQFDDT